MQRSGSNLERKAYVFSPQENADSKRYRFFIRPLDPTPQHSIADHQLKFSSREAGFSSHHHHYQIQQVTYNSFNIKAAIAHSFLKLKKIIGNRTNTPINDIDGVLVVDIDKEYFDRNKQVSELEYTENNAEQDFAPKVFYKKRDLSLNTYHVLVPTRASATLPVYKQEVYTVTMSPKLLGYDVLVQRDSNKIENPLTPSRNNSHLDLHTYHNDQYDRDLGEDVTMSRKTPIHHVGYRRERSGKSDWCSHIQPEMNKKSYAKLTKDLNLIYGNAPKIAELFADYAKKARGVSGLLHCHLFRHEDNVNTAKQIAIDLRKDEFKLANSIVVADYLCKKFDELAKYLADHHKKPIEPNGSFARRMNYAILQLTNGLCHSVDDFKQYQAQKMERKLKR